MTIPASQIVQVNPGVISAGGNSLALNGLVLTSNTRVPIGSVSSFSNAAAVSAYFGPAAAETAFATIYFGGYLNSTLKPSALLFSQYNSAAVSAYVRGVNAGLTLAQLQSITSGAISVTIDGTAKSTTTLNLSTATSFSNAASLIATALSLSGGQTCTYDSVSGGFVITSGTTGNTSTMTVPTGSAAITLGLSTGTVSPGASATTPSAALTAILQITANWATFTTLFDPDGGSGNTQKQLFAAWAAGAVANSNYAYICWDVDTTPTSTVPATTSLGYILKQANSSGTCLISSTDYTIASFIMGAVASINFNQTQGRITATFKQSPSALNGVVTNQTVASNLIANGYNFYGSYATANQGFIFFNPGTVSGQFLWLDAFVNQIWLNNNLQLNLMTLLTSVGSVPYTTYGYSLIKAACQGTIQTALNFGMFAPGVALSALQIAEVNAAAGVPIDSTLTAQGWYLQVLPATSAQRATRSSPTINFWYNDAGAVQQIVIASTEVE
jgi:hypothetical protein